MARSLEQWDFSEGDRERAATSLVFKKGDKEFLIAYVICDARNEKARAEDIARARLIAAAPDLLEACQGMLSDLKSWRDNPHGFNPMGHVAIAVAAIEKATGKSVPNA